MARVIVIRGDNYTSRRFGSAIVYRPLLGLRKATARFNNPASLHFSRMDSALGPMYSSKATYRAHYIDQEREVIPQFSTRLDDQMRNHDELVVLRCTFKGSPEPRVTWFKDQRPLLPTQSTVVTNSNGRSELWLFNVTKENTGFYSCRIENALGMRETMCHVMIGSNPNSLTATTGTQALMADQRWYRLTHPSVNLRIRGY